MTTAVNRKAATSTDASRRAAYALLALELRERREQAAREAEEKIEVIASFGSGQKTVVGRTLTEVGDILVEKGYRMDKAKPRSAPDQAQLVVPHKDGYKEAIVRVRRRK